MEAKQIGEKVWIHEYSCASHEGPCGLIIWFNGAPHDEDADAGSIAFERCDRTGPKWQVVQEEPLTLQPSILTRARGGERVYHGFITNGRWVAV